MSFLVRPTCIFVSKPLCRIIRLPRCASFCSLPKRSEGGLPSGLAMADEKMKRRPFRKVEMRAVQSEAELLEESPIGVKDDEALVRMWQGFGMTQEVPVLVKKLMKNTKALEAELGEVLKFGGPRGSLKVEMSSQYLVHLRAEFTALNTYLNCRQLICLCAQEFILGRWFTREAVLFFAILFMFFDWGQYLASMPFFNERLCRIFRCTLPLA